MLRKMSAETPRERVALDRVRAEAWDEGEKAGAENQSAWDGWRYKRGYPITNPYRAALDPEEPRG